MGYKILKIAFLIWLVLWANFILRDLFRKGDINDYKALLSRDSLEAKHSYVTGDVFYEFVKFCRDSLPPGSSYELIGMEKGSLTRRQAAYYLYPNLEEEGVSDFMLVYKASRPGPAGDYELFRSLDNERYILKRLRV